MSTWQGDFAYACRKLTRSPGFSAAAVLSISLGIAANTTIFSLVSTMVFQRPPIAEPDRLLTIHPMQHGNCCSEFSWPLYQDLVEQASSFSGLSARFPLVTASIGAAGEPQLHWGQVVTPNYFDVNGVPMQAGRGFLQEEDRVNAVVISDSIWRNRLGSDPDVVGRKVILSGRPYTVVGVTARGFRGIDLAMQSEFWVPLGNARDLMKTVPDMQSRTTSWLMVSARLRPGASRRQAEAELAAFGGRMAQLHQKEHEKLSFETDFAGVLIPAFKNEVLMFLGALSVVVLLVLLIACTNIANLLLAQTTARQREIAVRLAIGASRWQIARQMLAESLILAMGGGFAGVIIAVWATQALASFRLPLPIPLDVQVGLDWRVLAYTFALSVGAGLLFGLAPALAASRVILTGALKGEEGLGAGRKWSLRNALVFAQVAMSMLLLCATGLFLRSLGAAQSIPIGFRGRGLSMMSVDPMASGYTRERTSRLLEDIVQRVSGLPGVESAAVTDILPLSIGGSGTTMRVEGEEKLPGRTGMTDLFLVTPSYFRTMEIPLVSGRVFAGETGPQEYAVVNETFVRNIFKGRNPLGQRVMSGRQTYEVVGVVKDTKSRTLGESPRAMFYRQVSQSLTGDAGFLGFTLIVKGNPRLMPAVRSEIRAMDPNLPVYRVETMEDHLRNALFLPRLAGTLFGVFGFVGLLLASVGLYGVMGYSVSRRTREIGIRMALGAAAGGVQSMVVKQGMFLAAMAIVLGLAAALAVAKLASGILYGIKPHDPATFVMVTICLALVAMLACWLPARRAARVDPMKALRMDG